MRKDADWAGLAILAGMAQASPVARQRANAVLAAHGFLPLPGPSSAQQGSYAQPAQAGYMPYAPHQPNGPGSPEPEVRGSYGLMF